MAKIKSLSDQVYEFVLHQIKTGKISFGDKINEAELIDQLGISRTPIREALIQMAADNVLENVPRKGFFVKEVNYAEMMDIYDVVGVLEARVIEQTIPLIDEDRLSRLETAVEKLDLAIVKRDYSMYYDWQEEFHNIYREICPNRVLVETIEGLLKKVMRATYYSKDQNTIFSILSKVNEEHIQLLEAIKSKDIEKAKQCLYRHWAGSELHKTPEQKKRAEKEGFPQENITN